MKPENEAGAVDRRTLLAVAAGGALMAGGGPTRAAPKAQVADAHLHIFNGSDLPVGKFVRYVVIPERFPSLPPWVGAVADLAVNLIKPLAISVRREAGRRTFTSQPAAEITPESFGEAVGDYIAQRSNPPTRLLEGQPAPFDPALALSYRALLEEIAPGAGTAAAFTRDKLSNRLVLRVDDRAALRGTFQTLARLAETPPEPTAGPNKSLYAQLSLLGGAGRMIGWLYLMCKSRQSHIDKYLRDYSTKEAAPRLLINHLVDYDRWLDDGPSADSPHLEQIAFLATLAKRNAGKVDLRTFAGFCPLKNVLETHANPQQPSTLDALKAAYIKGDIAGFKIYPPMGFRPYGNTELDDQSFARPAGADEVVLRQWRVVSTEHLGAALDGSLKDFYKWCADHDAPLMAHGGPGNEAAPGFGQRANPKFWERVQRLQPRLRLNIGHLVNRAEPFVNVVLNNGPADPTVWSLDAPVRMMAAGKAGAIYGDLAYMPELIDNAKLRKDFFVALKRTFGPVDPDLRHILYGTDWILMGLESHDDDFLQTVLDGMTAASYSTAEKENILYLNARRFLKIDPA